MFEEGIRELQDLIKIINLSSYSDTIVFTPSLMRGNEYYTSTIFEANLITKTKKGEIQEGCRKPANHAGGPRARHLSAPLGEPRRAVAEPSSSRTFD